MNTLVKGDLTELAISTKLVKLGKIILKPITSGARYDLLIDEGNGVFSRIQCKNGRLRNNRIEFNTCSLNKETLERRSYFGEVEYFGVYCLELDKCFLIPIEEIKARTVCTLQLINNYEL